MSKRAVPAFRRGWLRAALHWWRTLTQPKVAPYRQRRWRVKYSPKSWMPYSGPMTYAQAALYAEHYGGAPERYRHPRPRQDQN